MLMCADGEADTLTVVPVRHLDDAGGERVQR